MGEQCVWHNIDSNFQAIYESSLPKQAGGALPSTPAGVLCSIADRLDSLVGLFGADQAPTASADIYGLRRAAYGMLEVWSGAGSTVNAQYSEAMWVCDLMLLQTLLHSGTRLDMRKAIGLAADLQPLSISEECRVNIFEFIVRRLEQLLVDSGIPVEATRAILSERSHDPVLAHASAKELQVGQHQPLLSEGPQADQAAKCELKRDLQAELVEGSSRLQTVATVLSRPVRLTRGKNAHGSVDVALFEHSEEQTLHEVANELDAEISTDISICDFLEAGYRYPGANCDYEPFLAQYEAQKGLMQVARRLEGPMTSFFDSVFVMCDDERMRNNRLALLSRIADLSKGVLDLTALPGF